MRSDQNEDIRTWVEVVAEKRQEIGISQDDLAHEARSYGAPKSLTGSGISQIKNGTRPYSTGFLEGIAGALGISPFLFAEYHLALARELLDERHFGLDEALRNLDQLPELIAEASDFDPVPTLRETQRQIDVALEPAAVPAVPGTAERAVRALRGRA